ncbi:uncharacterized protein [Aristolochia californica]|uniref:uncharacterized protein n=1 Tax=Aristolochia californica TaxID=171875 RepID=UPI0035E06F3F
MSRFASLCNNITHLFSPLLLNLSYLYSFLLSNPLYFAYLLFFSPYLLKLFSFLSPLLFCISLLFFCLVSFEKLPPSEVPEETVLQVLRTSFEIQSICVEIPTYIGSFTSELRTEDTVVVIKDQVTVGIAEENDLKEADGHYPICISKEIDPNSLENHNSSANSEELHLKLAVESKDPVGNVGENDLEGQEKRDLLAFCNQDRSGSMRREKEWRRTLACKLYEERRTTEGGEGMDLLWEVHEVDSTKTKTKAKVIKNKKEKAVEKDRKYRPDKKEQEEEEEDDDDEDMTGQLCCLQALKFTTGKMNLGMGRPNFVKFSKRLKGMGLFVRKDKRVVA